MLVRALEIKIGGIGRVGQLAKDGKMRRTGIEPHVDGVADLAINAPIDADLFGSQGEPCLDAALLHALGGLFQ